MEPITGLEPVTSSLPRKCSTAELYGLKTFGAGDGNRTHVISLEGWSSTIELHPQIFHLNGGEGRIRTSEG